jgi:hypothetical protein
METVTMRRHLMLATVVALVVTAKPALSAEADILGTGYLKCNEITRLYANADGKATIQILDVMVGQWAAGFMTATNAMARINHHDTKNLGAIPMAEQVITVRRYCKQHPNDQTMSGVIELMSSLTSNADGD